VKYIVIRFGDIAIRYGNELNDGNNPLLPLGFNWSGYGREVRFPERGDHQPLSRVDLYRAGRSVGGMLALERGYSGRSWPSFASLAWLCLGQGFLDDFQRGVVCFPSLSAVRRL